MPIIFARKRPATFRIGTRVVAVNEQGERAVELWDYNAPDAVNFTRAAEQVANGADVEMTGATGDAAIFRTA